MTPVATLRAIFRGSWLKAALITKKFIMLPLNVSHFVLLKNVLLSCAVRGQTIGYGEGVSMNGAKKVAATEALEYLNSLPANHSLLSTYQA
jgi:hypothetical protein